LERALSHRSYGKDNNERLEFLGDSIVNFIIANELYHRFHNAQEGQLSRLRANMVKGDTLAELAQEFDLSEYLLMGFGELRSGGAANVSILADAVEAIIGAIYLDSSMDVCYQAVRAWYDKRLNDLSLDAVYKDPKSLLQELVQSKQKSLPEYRLVAVTGQEHQQHFTVECSVALLDNPIAGEGSSRRRAEQEAAQNVLEAMRHEE